MKHEKLAKRVVEKLLKGENKILKQLQKQFECIEIVSEEANPVGFYINFKVLKDSLRIDQIRDFNFGDVDGNVDEIEGAVGFVLYVRNGYISMLEGYTNIIDEWPESDESIHLVYDNESEESRKIDEMLK